MTEQLRPAQRARISDTAGFTPAKQQLISCLIVPGVRLGFRTQSATVDVLLCFECDVALIAVADSPQPSASGNFDPAHGELAGIVQQLFPANSAMQQL